MAMNAEKRTNSNENLSSCASEDTTHVSEYFFSLVWLGIVFPVKLAYSTDVEIPGLPFTSYLSSTISVDFQIPLTCHLTFHSSPFTYSCKWLRHGRHSHISLRSCFRDRPTGWRIRRHRPTMGLRRRHHLRRLQQRMQLRLQVKVAKDKACHRQAILLALLWSRGYHRGKIRLPVWQVRHAVLWILNINEEDSIQWSICGYIVVHFLLQKCRRELEAYYKMTQG